MARTEYDDTLETLRDAVVTMSDLVCERMLIALESMERGDERLAKRVIEGDDEVNRRYLEIERLCIELLALQQPVAGDLRFITASFKIVTDLERVGDLASNVAEYAIDAGGDRYDGIDLVGIGESTVEMVEASVEAYATDDAETPFEVADRDDVVDQRCESASETIVRDLLDSTSDDEILLERVSWALLTIRDLERVGDHAVNVAARTLYMVKHDDALIY